MGQVADEAVERMSNPNPLAGRRGALQTRKPTGLPSWPILLLAGREKAGKSWAAVSASASPMVGRTLYIGIGEDDPDEYALIPGADFEIVEHDGTYEGILGAVRGAVAEPAGEKPTLVIVDSMTRLWNLIGDNMQAIANRRAKGRKNAAGDFTISMDLWNVAAEQWVSVMEALRAHRGPVILTARLEPVAVMDNGQPTTQKEWKIQGHKSLPFDATAIIEMRERGQFLITGVKSARVQLDKPKQFPEFTVDRLWSDLGLSDGTGERAHATVRADLSGPEPSSGGQTPRQAPPAEPQFSAEDVKRWFDAAAKAKNTGDLGAIWNEAQAVGGLSTAVDGMMLGTLLQNLKAAFLKASSRPEPVAEEPPAEGPAPVDAWAVADIPKDGES